MENRHRYRAWIEAHYYDAESNDKSVVLKIDAVDLNCVGDIGFSDKELNEALDRTSLTEEERLSVFQELAANNLCIEDEYFVLGFGDIEQCTGFEDSKNQLIYEGDIIRVEEPDEDSAFGTTSTRIEQVCFGGGDYEGCFTVKYKGYYLGYGLLADEPHWYSVEVIGNSHDNPELLEED